MVERRDGPPNGIHIEKGKSSEPPEDPTLTAAPSPGGAGSGAKAGRPSELSCKTLAQFEVFDLVGAGGFGEVYRARDTSSTGSWRSRCCRRRSPSTRGSVLRSLLGAEEIRVERSELAWQALNGYEDGGAGFADFVIGPCGREEGAESTWTFDRKAGGSGLFTVIGGTGPRAGPA